MINSLFSLPAQISAQPVADNPSVGTYQSAALWIDDLFAIVVTFGY